MNALHQTPPSHLYAKYVYAGLLIALLLPACQTINTNITQVPVGLTQSALITQTLAVPTPALVTSTPSIPDPTATPIDTPSPTNTPTPTCQQINPFNVSGSVLQNLGCGGIRQNTRSVVFQEFNGGFMLAFSKPGNVWDNTPGAVIYALSYDGQVWRVIDQFLQASTNPDSWYSCSAVPGRRPENSGIPWRGFGKAWCNNSGIRNALGRVKSGSGETKDTADYADYENGSRVVRFGSRIYVIVMNSNGVGTWQ